MVRAADSDLGSIPGQVSEFLPPENEVWGKVMFLHLCVIPFMGRGITFQHAP